MLMDVLCKNAAEEEKDEGDSGAGLIRREKLIKFYVALIRETIFPAAPASPSSPVAAISAAGTDNADNTVEFSRED